MKKNRLRTVEERQRNFILKFYRLNYPFGRNSQPTKVFLKEIKIVEPIHKVKFGVPYRRRFPLNYHSYQRVIRYMAKKQYVEARRFIKEVFPLKNPANCLAWIDFSELHLDHKRMNDFRDLLRGVIQSHNCKGDVIDFAHELWQQGFGKYNQNKLEENPYYTEGPYFPYQFKEPIETEPSDFLKMSP